MPIYTPPGIDLDVLYVIGEDDGFLPLQYARTPDGVGMVWYDDLAEAEGDMPIPFKRISMSDYHLTVIRGDDDPGRQRTDAWCEQCQSKRCDFDA